MRSRGITKMHIFSKVTKMDKRKDSVVAYKKVSEKVAGSNPALVTKNKNYDNSREDDSY